MDSIFRVSVCWKGHSKIPDLVYMKRRPTEHAHSRRGLFKKKQRKLVKQFEGECLFFTLFH